MVLAAKDPWVGERVTAEEQGVLGTPEIYLMNSYYLLQIHL